MTHSKPSRWPGKIKAAVESTRLQHFIVGVIIVNAVILGLETNQGLMATHGGILKFLDSICLAIFVIEISLKLIIHRFSFFKDGWNVFDFIVVTIAFAPGTGSWSVLRTLRVLRVLRLLTAIPSLKKVIAALLHAIPGLLGVISVMAIFFYTAAVLATQLFGALHPEWFGSVGASFYTLFQIMTLESWSMGIVRPVMETHPWAWGFFIPFIIIATFTILNLFLGIIVSTMQELALLPENSKAEPELLELLSRMESDLQSLKTLAEKNRPANRD